MAYCYGAYYYRGITDGLALGTLEFYQKFQLNYAGERNATVGSALSTNITYRFFSPMIVFQLVPTGQFQIYTTAGIGELQSGGAATLSKWSHASNYGQGVYDSTIDISKKLNKYVFRLGFGFTQFARIGGNFHLFLGEDLGFLIMPMADVSSRDFAAVKTNTSYFFQPTYFSIRAGIGLITHSKYRAAPWRLHAGADE